MRSLAALFLSWKRGPGLAERHIAAAIAGAEVIARPFPHLIVPEIFPRWLYREMCRAIPADAAWEAAGVYAPHFNVIGERGTPESLGGAAALWTKRYQLLVDFLNRCLAAKLAPAIDRVLARYVALGLVAERPPLGTGQSVFCRRPSGWTIAPHAHNICEVLQTLVYFPLPGSTEDLGTALLELVGSVDLSKHPLGRDLALRRDQVRDAARVPYRANTLLTFVTSPIAAHEAHGTAGKPPRQYLFTKLMFAPKRLRDGTRPISTADFY